MTYCGSDVRLIHIEKQRNAYWHLINSEMNAEQRDSKKIWKMKWHRLWVDVVLAPRNIYAYARVVYPKDRVVEGLWIHDVVDTNPHKISPCAANEIPIIVHAPSHQGLNGTDYIEQVIEKLRKEGVRFEYKKISNCPNEIAQTI